MMLLNIMQIAIVIGRSLTKNKYKKNVKKFIDHLNQ